MPKRKSQSRRDFNSSLNPSSHKPAQPSPDTRNRRSRQLSVTSRLTKTNNRKTHNASKRKSNSSSAPISNALEPNSIKKKSAPSTNTQTWKKKAPRRKSMMASLSDAISENPKKFVAGIGAAVITTGLALQKAQREARKHSNAIEQETYNQELEQNNACRQKYGLFSYIACKPPPPPLLLHVSPPHPLENVVEQLSASAVNESLPPPLQKAVAIIKTTLEKMSTNPKQFSDDMTEKGMTYFLWIRNQLLKN